MDTRHSPEGGGTAVGRDCRWNDPSETRDRADLTIAELCDRYFSEGCATKKPSTLVTDRSRIERHIKPLLGKRRLRTITKADVEAVLRDVASGKTARDERTPRGRSVVRGGKGVATKTVTLLAVIFEFAIRR